MINSKKIIIIAVIILLVLGVVWVAMKMKKQPVPAENNLGPNPYTSDVVSGGPSKPYFISGKVVSASAEEVEFTSVGKNYTARITPQTKIVKTDGTAAGLSEGKYIVLIFNSPPEDNLTGGVYSNITKIQLTD